MRFESMITPPEWVEGQEGYWLLVGRNTVLVRRGDQGPEFPRARDARDLGFEADTPQFLGLLEGEPVWAAGIDVDGDGKPDELQPESLFTLFPHVPEALWHLAGRAVQIAEWQRTHRYCGRCGEPTAIAPGERATKCPRCNLLSFPRLAPAVITAVTRDDEILLARGRQFGAPMYSVLAGFVEPGETLEEAVFREIKEEVGVEVTDIQYHSSQPWPFPHSLMIGFNARWVSGDIAIQESEIVDAQWFRADDLPNIPGTISIARRLIDNWLRSQGALSS